MTAGATGASAFGGPPARIVLATANAGKHTELVDLLGARIEVIARPPEIPEVIEDAGTLLGNARLKARAIMAATGEASLADDTGLEVDALGGRPGVDSSSFGGVDHDDDRNIAKVLLELRGVPPEQRTARFRTVLVLCAPDGRELVTQGTVEGTIPERPSGTGGFGYDPVFVPDEGDGRTFARMSRAEKAAISHRGRALRALADALDI